jgi:hypothetical protein
LVWQQGHYHFQAIFHRWFFELAVRGNAFRTNQARFGQGRIVLSFP